MPEACLKKSEGEGLDDHSLMWETEKVTVGTSYISPKAKKGQAIVCGPSGPMAGSRLGFVLERSPAKPASWQNYGNSSRKRLEVAHRLHHRMEVERGHS